MVGEVRHRDHCTPGGSCIAVAGRVLPPGGVPPDTNRRSSFAGQRLRLGARKPAGSSCRDEVVAALAVLAAPGGKQVFTVREV
jgi:hypothetical protein